MDASEPTRVCGNPATHPHDEKPVNVLDSSSASEMTDPSDGITDPSDGITDPSDEITEPTDEATQVSDEATQASDEATYQSDEATYDSDDELLPTHPMHKGIWFDPAEFVWAIGEKGRKMLIAGFASLKYFPSEIATVFNRGPYHVKLSTQFVVTFTCNAHDIVNAYIYMAKKKNVEWQQKYSEENREEWEGDFESRMELQGWVDELRRSMYNPGDE